jgi:hypothetical protein
MLDWLQMAAIASQDCAEELSEIIIMATRKQSTTNFQTIDNSILG